MCVIQHIMSKDSKQFRSFMAKVAAHREAHDRNDSIAAEWKAPVPAKNAPAVAPADEPDLEFVSSPPWILKITRWVERCCCRCRCRR